MQVTHCRAQLWEDKGTAERCFIPLARSRQAQRANFSDSEQRSDAIRGTGGTIAPVRTTMRPLRAASPTLGCLLRCLALTRIEFDETASVALHENSKQFYAKLRTAKGASCLSCGVAPRMSSHFTLLIHGHPGSTGRTGPVRRQALAREDKIRCSMYKSKHRGPSPIHRAPLAPSAILPACRPALDATTHRRLVK